MVLTRNLINDSSEKRVGLTMELPQVESMQEEQNHWPTWAWPCMGQ